MMAVKYSKGPSTSGYGYLNVFLSSCIDTKWTHNVNVIQAMLKPPRGNFSEIPPVEVQNGVPTFR